MKFKTKELLIIIALLIVGAAATVVFRSNYSSRHGNNNLTELPAAQFCSLMDQPEKRVWFYIYNRHEIKYSGILEEDKIQRVFIAQNGKATEYIQTGPQTLSIGTFSGLSPLAMVQRIEANMIAGYTFKPSTVVYDFSAQEDGDNVKITVKPENGVRNSSTVEQTVPDSELVTSVKSGPLVFAGYFHQSSSSDRFLKYQSVGLITPID